MFLNVQAGLGSVHTIQFLSQLLLKLKEVNDANQHFYGWKQCQKNNWIQKIDRVNRSSGPQCPKCTEMLLSIACHSLRVAPFVKDERVYAIVVKSLLSYNTSVPNFWNVIYAELFVK